MKKSWMSYKGPLISLIEMGKAVRWALRTLVLPEPGEPVTCLWARGWAFHWSVLSTSALGYFTRGSTLLITLESIKMWVAYAWSAPLIGQGLNSWGSTHLKQLWSNRRLWIQGEKATGAGHSPRKCVPNMDWWFWLIRICRKWGNAITILSQLSVGCSHRSVAKGS